MTQTGTSTSHQQKLALQTLANLEIKDRVAAEEWLQNNSNHQRANLVKVALDVAYPRPEES